MKAVFRHELNSYFTSLTAYVFGAFLLLFAGIYTLAYNLNNALVNFEYALAGTSFIFVVAIPVLTMRVLTEERRQKTDQLLYSLPISMTQVVLGKYFAMLVVLLIPTAVMGVYPLILSAYGNVYLPASYSSLLGLFLMGAALIAIGTYISSVTENLAVSAGLCFVVMLLNYFLSELASFVSADAFSSLAALAVAALVVSVVVYIMTKNGFAALMTAAVSVGGLALAYGYNKNAFSGLFGKIMEQLSLYERFYDIVYGVFDLTAVVYFLSVAGVFLFMSVQSMEKRRWSE